MCKGYCFKLRTNACILNRIESYPTWVLEPLLPFNAAILHTTCATRSLFRDQRHRRSLPMAASSAAAATKILTSFIPFVLTSVSVALGSRTLNQRLVPTAMQRHYVRFAMQTSHSCVFYPRHISFITGRLAQMNKNCLSCVMQILLHNFALAYYCLGHVQVHGCDLHYPTHRHTAIHLWENAQDVLRRFYSCSCHKYLQPTACWVSIAVLHSFIPLLQHFRVEARVPPTIPQHQFDDPEEIDIAVRHSKVLAAMTETLQWCWSVVRKQSHRVALTNFLAAAA
jgi:hypothetical protein